MFNISYIRFSDFRFFSFLFPLVLLSQYPWNLFRFCSPSHWTGFNILGSDRSHVSHFLLLCYPKFRVSYMMKLRIHKTSFLVNQDKNYLFLVWISRGWFSQNSLLVHQALLLSPVFSIFSFFWMSFSFATKQRQVSFLSD